MRVGSSDCVSHSFYSTVASYDFSHFVFNNCYKYLQQCERDLEPITYNRLPNGSVHGPSIFPLLYLKHTSERPPLTDLYGPY